MKNTRFALVLLSALLLAGCSSLRRSANRHFENGEYLAAASDYERLLERDPKDSEASERLHASRVHVLEDHLIDVRELRLSDNFEGALDQLKRVYEDEANWRVSPSGPAFSTQTDETEYLFDWLLRRALSDVQEQKPLRAKVFVDNYRAIFSVGPYQRKAEALERAIQTAGLKDCDALARGNSGPYARDFVNRYCILWGKSDVRAPATKRTVQPGFGGIELNGAIKDVPPGALATLSNNLLQGLKATPFYDADAPPLQVTLSGHFDSSYQEHASVGVYYYNVQIPYETEETVPYMVDVPYTDYEPQVDYTTGQSSQVPVTRHRTETRFRQETVTRYRQETRSLNYPSTDFDLNYALQGQAVFTLDKVHHVLPIENQLELHDNFHDAKNAYVGLEAKPKSVPTLSGWLDKSFQSSGRVLAAQVEEAWQSKYCQTPSGAKLEAVMKCVKGSPRTYDFVENYFKSKFGLTYDEVISAIGFNRAANNQAWAL